MFSKLFVFFVVGFVLFLPCRVMADQEMQTSHAMAMSGSPKYGPDFEHFEYVNPKAPKGGIMRRSAIGTYDSFHPFIPKGLAADGLGLIYDTLTVKSADEPFTEYGLLAEKIEMPKDRSFVIFHLNPEARFHDGEAVTAEDVVFSFKSITKKGDPSYKRYYQNVSQVKALDRLRVRFDFSKGTNKELPLIIGQMQVLPKHFWQDRDFGKAILEPPLGSGPYKIADFEPGQYVLYERVKDYWAKDHGVNKGRYNFDRIRYDYYRDNTVALEAFKSGEYDFRLENTSKSWARGYESPALEKGLIIKEEIAHEMPQGMQGFIFNQRRFPFNERKVREALNYAFDFEWSNKNLFYNQYTRTNSYFSNSELAARGLPGKKELELLKPLQEHLPQEVFSSVYEAPKTDASGGVRKNLRKAVQLLQEAGMVYQDGKLVDKKTGKPFEFEILLRSQAFERVVLPFKKNLARLGIEASIRLVDMSQYVNRVRNFDYDMIVGVIPQSLSPGNEQRYFFHSEAAQVPGTRNYMGIENAAIDALVQEVIQAEDRSELVTACRALDRALLWGFYVLPHWHIGYYRVAYWNKFSQPELSPAYDLGLYTWWVDQEKKKALLAEENKE